MPERADNSTLPSQDGDGERCPEEVSADIISPKGAALEMSGLGDGDSGSPAAVMDSSGDQLRDTESAMGEEKQLSEGGMMGVCRARGVCSSAHSRSG